MHCCLPHLALWSPEALLHGEEERWLRYLFLQKTPTCHTKFALQDRNKFKWEYFSDLRCSNSWGSAESLPEGELHLSTQCTFLNHSKPRLNSQCHSVLRSGTRVLFLPYSRRTHLKKINSYNDTLFATSSVIMTLEKHRAQPNWITCAVLAQRKRCIWLWNTTCL